MLGSAVRAFVVIAVSTAVAVLLAVVYGRAVGLLALLALAVVPLWMWFWLPRSAHRAFRTGNHARARWQYRVLGLVSLSQQARAAAGVSLAACYLGMEQFRDALKVLDRVEPDALGDAARAAWLNNRSYALARGDGDPEAALTCCEQAIALRPDVAGFRHTRGIALLAVGRIDEAIHELERLWDDLADQKDVEHSLLEAERCYDLGMAWTQKGEPAYASDYFQRAHQTSPGSPWARRAAGQIERELEPTLSDLLDDEAA